MDNTEKSVILQKELNTVPPLRRVRSNDLNLIGKAGKTLKLGLFTFTVIFTFMLIVILVNVAESNFTIGFKPAGNKSDGIYYTAAYNNVFADYNGKETFGVTVAITDENVRELKVPMLTVGEIIFNYISADYLSDDYEIDIPLDTVAENGLEIVIEKMKWVEYTVDMELEYETIYVDVQTIPKGIEVIVQTGENAYVTRTIRDKYLNGEYDSSVIKREIVNSPGTDEIIYRGVGGQFKTPKGVTYDYSYYIDVTATAYGVDTGYGGDSEYTYTGKVAEVGVIAVDPEVIPLGSKVYVVSDYMDHGVCYAEDIGSSIVGYHIDVHLGDDLEAQLAFGVRDARVYILE